MAVLIAPMARYVFQRARKLSAARSRARIPTIANMIKQANETRANAMPIAPNSGTATRINMNAAPHTAPSSRICANELNFKG